MTQKKRIRIMNIKTVKDRHYDTLDMGEYYNNLIGKIESNCSIFLYGTSGSGKSVFALLLADYFAQKHGKVLYNSHEEAIKQSIRDRAINFNISANKLYIGDCIDFEDTIAKIRSNYYRMVILDSVTYMQFTYEQLRTINEAFKKRKLIKVYVSFGTGYKKPTCSNDIMHACDVKIFFNQGIAMIDSRYLHETKKIQLFKPKQAGVVQQGQLF